jgi:hypothetical protein
MLCIERVAMSIIQTAESGVAAYLGQISKEQNEVDACIRLVEAECMLLSLFIANS